MITSAITLRPYQEQAVSALIDALNAGNHPVCAIATGGGKSVIIAALCEELPGRILVATHRKELLQQNESALVCFGGDDLGIFSAGLNRREMDTRVVFGGLQSIYSRMDDLQRDGTFDFIMVDECHRCSPNPNSMYAKIFGAAPNAQRIGMSATPYRLDDGPIWGKDGSYFDSLAVHVSMAELIGKGYLTPLVGVQTACELDLSSVRSRGGDFVTGELSQASSEESIVKAALDEITYLASDRRSWALFCVDRSHARIVLDGLLARGIDAGMVLGDTPSDERSDVLGRFQDGRLRVLVSVGVVTEGFDSPRIDCVALLRASQSKSLITQMIGRGSRLFDGKRDCLVLDLSDNLRRHAPLDGIPSIKKSPARVQVEKQKRIIRAREEAERKAKHGHIAARGIDPITGEDQMGRGTYLVVEDMSFMVRAAKKYPTRDNIICTYKCRTLEGAPRSVTKFLLVEYPGRPWLEAQAWFNRRGLGMPSTARYGLKMAWNAVKPDGILVEKDGQWDRIVMEYFPGDNQSD